MNMNKLYTYENKIIKKDGHTMFPEDIVRDLNAWRNSARKFRNENAILLKDMGKIQEQLKESLIGLFDVYEVRVINDGNQMTLREHEKKRMIKTEIDKVFTEVLEERRLKCQEGKK